jgi:hypothetical protein
VLSDASKTLITPHIQEAILACKAAVERNGVGGAHLLRILSPLAEGADRCVADIALSFGYELEAIIPFAKNDYENDFERPVNSGITGAKCIDEFRSLLSRASNVLELDGGRDAEAASYEAAGRVVARNADLLIAVWNGNEGAGRGGTADMVRFAVEQGVPVWWVPVDGSPPGWLASLQQTIRPKSAPSGNQALEHLESYLADLLGTDGDAEDHAHGFFGWLSQLSHRGGRDTATRQAPVKRRWFGVYSLFERALTRSAPKEGYPAAVTSDDKCWLLWQSKSASADRDAQIYMAGYRSSYVIVLFFAALALIMAVASLAWPKTKIVFSFLEITLLAGIGLIIFIGQREGWHSKAMRRRLSAELSRTQAFLSLLADCVPIPAAATAQQEIRQFLRFRRSAPITSGYISQERMGRIRHLIRTEMLENQKIYHRNRKNKMIIASHYLSSLGEFVFVFIFIAVLIKISLIIIGAGYSIIFTIGVLSAALPAVAAFSVGMRSYAEFDLLAEQSKRMEAVMSAALHRLDRVDIEAVTASQRMADIVRDAAGDMLQELQGWSAVARSKVLEAG